MPLFCEVFNNRDFKRNSDLFLILLILKFHVNINACDVLQKSFVFSIVISMLYRVVSK